MPLIISIAHQKGGVGKSTLALNLTSFFTRQGIPCAVVDADAQGSIANLIAAFGQDDAYGTVKLIPRSSFAQFADLQKMAEYQILLIDTPPYLSTNLMEIFQISDFVLVPTKPAVFDMFAIEGTIDMLREAQRAKPSLKVGVVINMSMQGTRHTDEIRAHLVGKNIHVMQTEVVKRVEFERCLLYSDSIFAGNDEKAKDDISKLGNEIIAQIEADAVVAA